MKTVAPPEPDAAAGKKIDFVARRLGLVVKPHSFKRSSRRFNRLLTSRNTVDAAQAFNLQASQGNLGSEGRFCINLGVWFAPLAVARRALKRWSPRKDPASLAPHECHFSLRIHSIVPAARDAWWPTELKPGADSWFDVGPERDIGQLADSLARIVERFVLPWFEARASLEAVALGMLPVTAEDRAIALALVSGPDAARAFLASNPKRSAEVEAWLAKR